MAGLIVDTMSAASSMRCSNRKAASTVRLPLPINPVASAAPTSKSWTCSHKGTPSFRAALRATGTAIIDGATVNISSGRSCAARALTLGQAALAKLR